MRQSIQRPFRKVKFDWTLKIAQRNAANETALKLYSRPRGEIEYEMQIRNSALYFPEMRSAPV